MDASGSIFFTIIFSLDATEAAGLGKFVNDCAPQHANAKMKIVVHDGNPHLCLFACVEGIPSGTELR